MRKVIRPKQIPMSLAKHGERWTKELLDAIAEAKRNRTKVLDKFYYKYKKADVLEALKRMYGDKVFSYCCYCESIIDDVSYEQIEHRMPKRKTIDKYPKKTYDWENLHLVCGKCNGHKKEKYDENEPILDAAVDDIERHLRYKLTPTKGVYRETLSYRGITTVEDADLDRPSLREARRRIWVATENTISEIRQLGNDPKAYTANKALRDTSRDEHGSLIKYLMISGGVWS